MVQYTDIVWSVCLNAKHHIFLAVLSSKKDMWIVELWTSCLEDDVVMKSPQRIILLPFHAHKCVLMRTVIHNSYLCFKTIRENSSLAFLSVVCADSSFTPLFQDNKRKIFLLHFFRLSVRMRVFLPRLKSECEWTPRQLRVLALKEDNARWRNLKRDQAAVKSLGTIFRRSF